jgi:hypothetical protein
MSHSFQSRRKKSNGSWLFQCKNSLKLLFVTAFIQIFLFGSPRVQSFNLSLKKKSLRYGNKNRIFINIPIYYLHYDKNHHSVSKRLELLVQSEKNESEDDFLYIKNDSYFKELGFKSIKKVEKGNSISSSDNAENQSMAGLIKYFVPGFVAIWAAGYGAVFLAEISGDLISCCYCYIRNCYL